MESSGAAALMRYRKFESYFDTNSTPSVQETCEEPERKLKGDDHEDDDRRYLVFVSCFRIVACIVTMMVTTAIWVIVMVLLLPWPNGRMRQGNVYGHVTGRMLERFKPSFCTMSLSGCLGSTSATRILMLNYYQPDQRHREKQAIPVVTEAHLSWRRVLPVPISVKFLRPIPTEDWTDDKIDDNVNKCTKFTSKTSHSRRSLFVR